MIRTLPLFILCCIKVCIDILRMAIVKAIYPRMPLPNWTKEDTSMVPMVQVDNTGRVENALSTKLQKRTTSGLGLGSSEETPRFEILNNVNVTPTKEAAVVEFSVYPKSPTQKNCQQFLTPIRSPTRDVGFTVLRNASDRVSEILRENRRRLDAGEDLNTIRREARRKRARELAAFRKGRTKLRCGLILLDS